jgi:hypothetical protein
MTKNAITNWFNKIKQERIRRRRLSIICALTEERARLERTKYCCGFWGQSLAEPERIAEINAILQEMNNENEKDHKETIGQKIPPSETNP